MDNRIFEDRLRAFDALRAVAAEKQLDEDAIASYAETSEARERVNPDAFRRRQADNHSSLQEFTMEKYCDASNAQDDYERGLQIGEDKQIEALSRAEYLQIDAQDLAYEFAECADELNEIIGLYRAGRIPMAHLGLALLNISKATAQREAGVFAAPEAQFAVRMAMEGKAL
jgi:hypothetical protein